MRQIARKQFNSMLKHMVSYPLICIYGPDGFGKTTAVLPFCIIERKGAAGFICIRKIVNSLGKFLRKV